MHFKKITNSIAILKKKKNPELIDESIESMEKQILEEKQKCAELMKEFEETGQLRSEVSILVQNLTKQYGKQMVIQGVDFTVNQKECFGLLGMNSTGKSTILKILTGETNITKGNAIIQKYYLDNNFDQFSGLVGYCPQYGGLNEYLTGRQNLTFFAIIRGIPYKNIQREVDKWMDVFDLLDFENVQIYKCSWGIQKKICILQCLIGDLPILYLDSPTIGIDALSKNVLFDVLNQSREMGRSLLITTHSIEDVEALCLRVSILREGKFIIIGNFEDLKNMYGNVILFVTLNNLNQELNEETKFIKYIIIESFPGIILKETSLENTLTFEIPKHIDYNNVLTLLRDLSAKYSSINDFSLNQPTFEQIFIELTKQGEKPIKRYVFFHFVQYLREMVNYLLRIRRLFQIDF
ncbi:phospholipid-transporting ATPase ABCA3-like [Leptopilina boulardi]|uniref:phospholipid-transporting ATPase ABCA3-like n=1 Tax=Leptopilina boulardi TaxID=63433 RepID=UPI0021F56323|nr:phospholipid-transporting ATPase ABCA3-like [Leptopilina boulardi]